MLKLKAHVVIGMLILTIATQNAFGITVTSNLDVGTPGSGTEVCVGTDTGSGLTLREAIEIVNLGGTDLTIDFDLPVGKETIFICSLLPIITPDDVSVDGSNIAGSGVQVTIDGTNISNNADLWGLRFFGSSRCIIQNLTITNISTSGGPVNNNINGIQFNSCPDCIVENVTITNLSTTGSNADINGINVGSSVRSTIRGTTLSDFTTTGSGNSNINGIFFLSSAFFTVGESGSENAVLIDNLSATLSTAIGIGTGNTCSNSSIENATISNLSGTFCLGFQNETINCNNISFNDCLFEDINAERDCTGILSRDVSGDITNTTFRRLTSSDNPAVPSGNVIAISLSDTGSLSSISGVCNNNLIEDLTSGDHATDSTGLVQGIFCNRIFTGSCRNNIIKNLTSGVSGTSTSGAVTGIRINETITPLVGTEVPGFDNNTIQSLTSGDASVASGTVLGIDVGIDVETSLDNNDISYLTSGASTTSDSGAVAGIQIAGSTFFNTMLNHVCSLTSGEALSGTSGDVTGISVADTIALDFSGNSALSLRSSDAEITGNVTGLTCRVADNCSENIVTGLESGIPSLGESGTIYGIRIVSAGTETAEILQDCNQNKIGIDLTTIGTECFCPEFPFGSGSDVGTELICEGSDFLSVGLTSAISTTTSGDIFGISIENDIGNDCNANEVRNLTSSDAIDTGVVIGITAANINNDCSNNQISHLLSGDASGGTSGGTSGIVLGITANSIFGNCSFNTISESSTGNTTIAIPGSIRGMFVGTIGRDTNNNTVFSLTSGNAIATNSNLAIGISVGSILGSCNTNCVCSIISGDAFDNSGDTTGISVDFIGFGSTPMDCSGNTIHMIKSGNTTTGTSGDTFGISSFAIGGACNNNWITTIVSGDAPASSSGESAAIQVTGTIGASCSSNAIGIDSPVTGSEFGSEIFFNCFDGTGGTGFCEFGIQSGNSDGTTGSVEGIKASTITADANNNHIECLISGDSATANSGNVFGIDAVTILQNCNANTIATLISGLALLASSGKVTAIDVDLSVGEDCNNNSISSLTSSESEDNSGDVRGISLGEGNGTAATTVVQNCNSNSITLLKSGESHADVSGDVTGIDILGIAGSDCSNNSVTNLTSDIAPKTGNVTGINAQSVSLDASDNTITDLTSGDTVGGTEIPGTGTEIIILPTTSGDITGLNIEIGIGQSCNTNTITDLTSGIAETESGRVHGISVGEDNVGTEPTLVIRNCNNNNLSNLISGLSNTDASGAVNGIFINNGVVESCSNNDIVTLTSGSAPADVSGNVTGINILIGLALGNCSNNSISSLTSSTATETGDVTGIETQLVGGNSSNNTITDLTSGVATGTSPLSTSGNVVGIDVSLGIIGACSNNSISNLDSSMAIATGKVAGIETPIIGQDCSSNTITTLSSGDTIVAGTDSGSGTGGGTGPMPTTSGDVTGIDVNERIVQDCNTNSVTILTSGDAHDNSGRVFGIALGDDNGSDSGTEPTVQNCSGNTIATLESGASQTESSGDVTGLFVNEDIAQNCSNNAVSSLTSGVAPDTSGEVNGIDVVDTIGGECTDNTVSNLTNSPADITLDTTGIEAGTVGGFLARNTVFNITSEPGTTTGGNVFGINVENQAQGTVFNNTINNLEASGTMAVGITINELQADALNNTVIDVELLESGTDGSALLPAEAAGILIGTMSNDQQATCNDTEQIQSLRDGNASGLWIKNANSILVSNNTSKDITSLDTAAAHGIRLGSKSTNESVQSSLGEENLIRNINGGVDNGFGITIENNQSTKNKLFGNSISEIETLAINYENPPFDGILNITSITCLAGDILRVQGSLIPLVAPIGEYRIELFASPDSTPPESYQLIGFFNYIPAPPAFDVMVPLIRPLLASEFVTATATALTVNNKNTTPVSNPLDGCDSVGGGTDIDPICAFISICDPNCTIIQPSPPPSTSCPVPVPAS